MKFDQVKSVLLLAAVGAAAYVGWKAYKGGTSLAGLAAQSLDVTSTQNPVYQGANKIAQVLSGDSTQTVGSWLYNLTHADENLATMPRPAPSAITARPDLYTVESDVTGTAQYDAMGNVISAGAGAYNSWNISAAAANDARRAYAAIDPRRVDR